MGVAVETLDAYAAAPDARGEPAEPGVVLGFGMIDGSRIDEGLARLARAFGDVSGVGSAA